MRYIEEQQAMECFVSVKARGAFDSNVRLIHTHAGYEIGIPGNQSSDWKRIVGPMSFKAMLDFLMVDCLKKTNG